MPLRVPVILPVGKVRAFANLITVHVSSSKFTQ
jgi:hypothetical protein